MTAISVACAATAYTLAIWASGPGPLQGRQWLLACAGAALTLVAVGLPAVEQWRHRRFLRSAQLGAEEARARLRTTFNDVLDPIVLHLGKVAIAEPERQPELRAQAITLVLNSAILLIRDRQHTGDARARACWYELTGAGPRQLRPSHHIGRGIAPTTVFVEGVSEGAEVFGALDRGAGRFFEDVGTRPPPGWDNTARRTYKTFITMPVRAESQCYGMLALDSLEPGDLRGDDVPLVRLLAHLLAIGLACSRPCRPHTVDLRGADAEQPPDERT